MKEEKAKVYATAKVKNQLVHSLGMSKTVRIIYQ